METLRRPFFILAVALMVIVVLVEIGAAAVLNAANGDIRELVSPGSEVGTFLEDFDAAQRQALVEQLNTLGEQENPPGRAIPYLALVDGVLLFTVGLMGSSLLVGERLQARVQGCTTAVFAVLLILGGLALLIAVITLLTVMVGLFLAAPFGTLVYMAIYGFFNRGGASVTLSLLMALKVGFVLSLVMAQQRFLQNKGLILLILTSFAATMITGFLHGVVPLFLVSITDAIAAIIVNVLACGWALFLLFGAVPAVLKALRPDRV